MVKTISLCELHLFFTLPNSCQLTTVRNAANNFQFLRHRPCTSTYAVTIDLLCGRPNHRCDKRLQRLQKTLCKG